MRDRDCCLAVLLRSVSCRLFRLHILWVFVDILGVIVGMCVEVYGSLWMFVDTFELFVESLWMYMASVASFCGNFNEILL